MVFTVGEDGLSIKITPEFLTEMKELIQKQRELNRDAANFHKSMEKQFEENEKKLEALQNELLNAEKQAQAQTRQ